MIDLHTHSTCSDGTLSPRDLVRFARKRGLTAMGLTDHDTFGGIAEAQDEAKAQGLRFIPGIELTAAAKKGELHILGLGITKNLTTLEKRLEKIVALREKRNRQMVEKMQKGGIRVSYEDIRQYSGGEVIGRTHFANFLVDRKECRSIDEAFLTYLRKGKPFFTARELISLDEAAAWIIDAGGKPFVAHPLSLRLNFEAMEEALDHWKDLGILGIETMHPSANRSQTRRLEEMARRRGMLMIAGSDFHGKHLPGRKLGRTGWGEKIPPSYDEVLEAFE